jgi:hypothetical protein
MSAIAHLWRCCDGKVCGMIGTVTYPSYEHNDPGGEFLPW